MFTPSGTPENGEESRQGGILATTIPVTVLASVVAAMRFATRIWIVPNVAVNNHTMLCATLEMITECGLVIVRVHYGLGRHNFQKYFIRPIQGAIVFLVFTNIILHSYGFFNASHLWDIGIKRLLKSTSPTRSCRKLSSNRLRYQSYPTLSWHFFLWKAQIAPRIKVGQCSLMALGFLGYMLTRARSTATCYIVFMVYNWQNITSDPT